MTRAKSGSTMTTGTLAARTGCNVETIRYYERIGLLPVPTRSAGGHRFYSSAHARRLTFIRHARSLGFALDEVRALLRLADDENRSCTEVRRLAAAHLDAVRAKIADLNKMEQALEETIARCPDSAARLPDHRSARGRARRRSRLRRIFGATAGTGPKARASPANICRG